MITRNDIERLAAIESPSNPVISLYLSIDKSRTDDDHAIRLKNIIRDAESKLDDSYTHDQRETLKSDLEMLHRWVNEETDGLGEGVALFSANSGEFFETVPVPKTIESQLTIDFTPNLAPLVRLLEDTEPFCTCIISRDHARIFVGRILDFQQIAEMVDDEVPGQHDQGGWSQSRYERHIEEHVHRHFKTVAESLFERFENDPFRFLILAGPDEVVAGFQDELHSYLKDRIAGHIHLGMDATDKDVFLASQSVIGDWKHRQEAASVDAVRENALSDGLGVKGAGDTIQALQQGQVFQLVVDEAVHVAGGRCKECGALQMDVGSESRCIYCEGEIQEMDDIIPSMITNAYQQKADVMILAREDQRDRMSELGGVGALLRYRTDK